MSVAALSLHRQPPRPSDQHRCGPHWPWICGVSELPIPPPPSAATPTRCTDHELHLHWLSAADWLGVLQSGRSWLADEPSRAFLFAAHPDQITLLCTSPLRRHVAAVAWRCVSTSDGGGCAGFCGSRRWRDHANLTDRLWAAGDSREQRAQLLMLRDACPLQLLRLAWR